MYEALIVVQPSSLQPPNFDRLLEAIRSGVPVAIFEDPAPVYAGYITPTGMPKQIPAAMGGGGMIPKGDIRQLWELLGLNVPGKAALQGLYTPALVWQLHNPYPTLDDGANPLWVFIDEDAPGIQEGQALSAQSPITAGMQQVLTLYPGAVQPAEGTKLTHTPLLVTGDQSGLISSTKLREILTQQTTVMREASGLTPYLPVAMTVEGDPPKDTLAGMGADAGKGNSDTELKAVYVADSDLMIPQFSMIRADPNTVTEARYQFQNVTFILNCIDWLTGETDFIEVRKHQPIFTSLRMIDAVKEEARAAVRTQSQEYQRQYEQQMREAQESMSKQLQKVREEVEKLREESADGKIPPGELQAKEQRFQMLKQLEERKLDVKNTKTEREREQKIREIERRAAEEVTAIQNKVKAAAVVLPCIPPLIVGVVVFASRRLRERENISKSRLK